MELLYLYWICLPLRRLPGGLWLPKLTFSACYGALLMETLWASEVRFTYTKCMKYELNAYNCFTGILSLCCPVGRVEGHCVKEGGCVEQQRPCLLQLLKENWLKIEVELKSDKHKVEMMKDTKQKFDKVKNNKKLSMEKKDEVKVLMHLLCKNALKIS